MDKTGTLTRGEPEVTEVVTDGIDEGEMLRLVAAVERESEHPVAEAVASWVAIRSAVAWLSPVSITTWVPASWRATTAAAAVGLAASAMARRPTA